MNLKPAAILLMLILTTTVTVLTTTVSAATMSDVSLGVKQGDWIEYNVTFTGNPPAEHDVVWARMEVMNVEATRVNATFISRLANDTILNVMEELDFEKGRLVDMFIIPAGLNTSDTFYDQTVGNVTIDQVEVRTYAGSARTVVHAEAVDTQWYWDQTTGVALEARTSNAVYTLDTVAASTGLWSPQILGLDPIVSYVLIVLAVAAAIAVIVVGLLVRRKRKHGQSLPQKRFQSIDWTKS
jgi:hypothetical protein